MNCEEQPTLHRYLQQHNVSVQFAILLLFALHTVNSTKNTCFRSSFIWSCVAQNNPALFLLCFPRYFKNFERKPNSNGLGNITYLYF